MLSVLRPVLPVLMACLAHALSAQTLYVSPAGNDANPGTDLLPWRTIQKACSSAVPGSTVLIRGGVYNEKVTVTVSGSAIDGFITFQSAGPDTAILDGTGITGECMVLLTGRSYVKLIGLTIRNNAGLTDGSGVRIEGAADHIELRNLTIHAMRGDNAMGITCYGTNGTTPISDLIIDGNTIFDCDAAPSEALTLNGNVDGFAVTNNTVHDINNIGIVFIGGEGTCPVPDRDKARNGVCRGNHVYRARSNYGGGYAAGLYVDGGAKIVVENNIVHENDVGIEIGCENHGRIADSITVRNNLVYANDKRGISFGGYNYPSTGQVRACEFTNNTLFRNDVLATGDGDVVVEYALGCRFRNNLIVAGSQNLLLTSNVGSSAGNLFDYNLWYAPAGTGGATFAWGGSAYTGFTSYRSSTGQDAHSGFADPQFVSGVLPVPDLHLQAGSPAVDAGDPVFTPGALETDIDGAPRIVGARVDAGADELSAPPQSTTLLTPPNGALGIPPGVAFSWLPVPLASGYLLQVAADSLLSTLLFEDSVMAAGVSAGPFPPSAPCFWRVRAFNSTGAGPWSTTWRFTTTDFDLRSYPVAAGWNMVSLPLDVFDSLRTTVYPTAISSAFAFEPETGYSAHEGLLRGKGYWLKFPVGGDVSVAGRAFSADTIALHAGWNMIGALSAPVDTAAVQVEPAGLLQSVFFRYDGAFVPADSLLPSRAYWVRAASPGALILESGAAARQAVRRLTPGSEGGSPR